MRRFSAIVAMLVSSTCFAQSPEELRQYIEVNRPLVEAGQLKRSEYYKQVHARLIALNAPGDMLSRSWKLVSLAEQYEDGRIDKAGFESQRNTLRIEQANADEARQNAMRADAIVAQQVAVERDQQQRSSNILSLAAQLLQAGGPRTLHSSQQSLEPQPTRVVQAGVTAYFTGQQQQVQTVTYQYGWNCEYRYINQTFWRTFVGSCPASVQVQ